MCGISGKLSWDKPICRRTIEQMTERLTHRGPDAFGVHVRDPIGLGHRRLSIIDLRAAGNQPMSDASERYWLVFNGEIYNFRELKEELMRRGAQFRTRTDTEVILESYKAWGLDCLDRFNGMFAFALWDSAEQQLLLARDRLGKKPLFYHVFPDGSLSFASELKALLADREITPRINPEALSQYLSLNYTLTRASMVKGVQKLAAAHYMRVRRDRAFEEKRYWDLAQHFRQKRRYTCETEATEALQEILTQSVNLRLVSDVPLGAFLSGGIDSSAIVSSMVDLQGPGNTHTFSIGFQEPSYSELEYAKLVASRLNVDHHAKVVTPDIEAELGEIAYYADEPFADSSMIPMYFLSAFARKHVTVCLSGDGGDEIFAGYPTYVADKIRHCTRWLPRWCTGLLLRAVTRAVPVSLSKVSFDYKLRQFLKGHGLSHGRAHYTWREIFSRAEKAQLVRPEYRTDVLAFDPYDVFAGYDDDVQGCHYLDRSMYVDIKTWLVDDILVKLDRSTMAHGLEARAPLLDYRLVEFAASLPVGLKMKAFRTKHVLKLSQRHRIPERVIHRKKAGFNAPISHWLGSSLASFIDRLLSEKDSLFADMFDRRFIEQLWRRHLEKREDGGLKLLAIINFYLWCGQYLP